MSFDLYCRWFTWAMLTDNPAWKQMLRRLDAMYPSIGRAGYLSSSTEGY